MTLKVWLSDQIRSDKQVIRDALSSRSWVLPDNCLRPQMSNWCHASVPTTPIQLQLWAWRQRYTIDNFCGPEIISPTYWTNSIGVTNNTNFNSDQQEQSCLLSNKSTLGWEIGDEAPWPTSWQCTWWLSQIRAMASFTWAETRANVHFNFRNKNLDAIPASPEILFQNIELKT